MPFALLFDEDGSVPGFVAVEVNIPHPIDALRQALGVLPGIAVTGGEPGFGASEERGASHKRRRQQDPFVALLAINLKAEIGGLKGGLPLHEIAFGEVIGGVTFHPRQRRRGDGDQAGLVGGSQGLGLVVGDIAGGGQVAETEISDAQTGQQVKGQVDHAAGAGGEGRAGIQHDAESSWSVGVARQHGARGDAVAQSDARRVVVDAQDRRVVVDAETDGHFVAL